MEQRPRQPHPTPVGTVPTRVDRNPDLADELFAAVQVLHEPGLAEAAAAAARPSQDNAGGATAANLTGKIGPAVRPERH